MATQRISAFVSQLTPGQKPMDKIQQKNPDDIVITLAIRTPLCKARKGGLKDTRLELMVMKTLEQVIRKSNLDPQLVEDICLGNVSDSKASYYVRAAMLAAGFPITTAGSSVNRFCSSGLKAVQDIAGQISSGAIEIGIAMGAESMTEGGDALTRPFDEEVLAKNQHARDCMQPMGWTSENVGADFNISREMQDRYAAESYRRAEAAQKAGWFDDEITPITVKVDGKDTLITKDEGVRWGTTYESLSKIRPAFPDFGDKSTAGNSSQVTDGCAAILLMKRSKALELGQPIMAKFVGATVAGLAPRIMGIGPTVAVPKLLSQFNLSIEDIDVVELNEAFASMACYCRDVLKIDWQKLNIRGGAIALGHPLGCTGARQIVTGLSEARRQKKKVLLTTMCIGSGQGMAGLFINEQV